MQEINTFDIEIPSNLHVKAYLSLFIGAIKLTDSELLVLETIIHKHLDLEKEGLKGIWLNKILFNAETRKELYVKLGYSYHSFNNYFKSLKDKKLIIEIAEGNYKIDERLLPKTEVVFKFKLV